MEFSSEYFTETLLCYIPKGLHLRFLLLPFTVLLQNKHATLAKKGEKLISAQPPISAHSQGPKIS